MKRIASIIAVTLVAIITMNLASCSKEEITPVKKGQIELKDNGNETNNSGSQGAG